MTNFYEYECTPKLIDTVEKLNYRNERFFSFNIFKKLIVVRREDYQVLEDFSKQIGELISLEYNQENE